MSNFKHINKTADTNLFIFIQMITMRDFCTVMSHGLQYTITIYIVNFFVYTKTLNIFGHFSIIYLRYFTASYILLHKNCNFISSSLTRWS